MALSKMIDLRLENNQEQNGSDIFKQFMWSGLHTDDGYAVLRKGAINVCLFTPPQGEPLELIVCQYETEGDGEPWRTGKLTGEYIRDYIREKDIDPEGPSKLEIFSTFSPSDDISKIFTTMKARYPLMELTVRFATLYNIPRTTCHGECFCKKVVNDDYTWQTILNLRELGEKGSLRTFDEDSWAKLRDLLKQWDAHYGNPPENSQEIDRILTYRNRLEEDVKIIKDCSDYNIPVNIVPAAAAAGIQSTSLV